MLSPKLIIIDTLARCFGDGDENKAQDMGRFIMGLDRWHQETGANILLVHHAGWGKTDHMRGTSSLRAGGDNNIKIEWNEDSRIMTVEADKLKDMPEPEPKRFRRVPAGNSLVLKEELDLGGLAGITLSSVDKKILEYLRGAAPHGANVKNLVAHTGKTDSLLSERFKILRDAGCMITTKESDSLSHRHLITRVGFDALSRCPI
jgi:hypothetical protein